MGQRLSAVAAWCAVGLLFGGLLGCLLELDHELSCGDGVVDPLAGEECDPRAPQSPHKTYCLDKDLGSGVAVCDDACMIVADRNICASCGDGKAAPDDAIEQCDGAELKGRVCPSGKGQLGCSLDCSIDPSGCDSCGDGKFSSEVEECDFSTQCNGDDDCPEGMGCDTVHKTCVTKGDISVGLACSSLLGPKGFYTKGVVHNADCGKDCTYDRRRCSYCGDGKLTGAYQDFSVNGPFEQDAEFCDDKDASLEQLVDYCQELCTEGNKTTVQLRCEHQCNDTCTGFVDQNWEDPVAESAKCCVLGGEPCDGVFPCCYALDHPEDADEACLENTLPEPLCRSG